MVLLVVLIGEEKYTQEIGFRWIATFRNTLLCNVDAILILLVVYRLPALTKILAASTALSNPNRQKSLALDNSTIMLTKENQYSRHTAVA